MLTWIWPANTGWWNAVHWDSVRAWIETIGIWIGSIGTVAAFFVGLSLFRSEAKDRRRAAAKGISAWATGVTMERDDIGPDGNARRAPPPWRLVSPATQTPSGARIVSIRAVNRGDEPVVACWVRASNNWSNQPDATATEYLDVLAPDAVKDFEIAIPLEGQPFLAAYVGFPPVEIRFTDTTGRGWHRTATGVLVDLGITTGQSGQTKLWSSPSGSSL